MSVSAEHRRRNVVCLVLILVAPILMEAAYSLREARHGVVFILTFGLMVSACFPQIVIFEKRRNRQIYLVGESYLFWGAINICAFIAMSFIHGACMEMMGLNIDSYVFETKAGTAMIALNSLVFLFAVRKRRNLDA